MTNYNVILTGFRPFDNYPVNPSWEAAKKVRSYRPEVLIKELTVERLQAHTEITELLVNNACDILLLCGLADGRCPKLEKKARKPEEFNSIIGPSELTGYWPLAATVTALKNAKIVIESSDDAGQYVCESTYWSALNFKRLNGYPKLVVFLHVPLISDEWTVEIIAKTMMIGIDTAMKFLSEEPAV